MRVSSSGSTTARPTSRWSPGRRSCPLTIVGTRAAGRPHRATCHRAEPRSTSCSATPWQVDAQPWPRTREQVLRASALLLEHMRGSQERALARIGRPLPGPLPATEREPDPDDRVRRNEEQHEQRPARTRSVRVRHGAGRRAPARCPVLAVVGRPNVGKSTLVNRIIGRREAVVEDRPGRHPRPRLLRRHWNGRAFTVVDTGGWDPDARGLAKRIARPGRDRRDPGRRRAVRRRRHRRHHRLRRGRRQDPAQVGQAGRAGGQQGRRPCAPRPRPTGCGTSGSASRTRSPRCTAAARATCWTPYSTALPETPPETFGQVGGPRRIAHRRQAQRRQVVAAEQARRVRAGSSSTTSPAPPSTRSTS